MIDVIELEGTVFSGLSVLVIEDAGTRTRRSASGRGPGTGWVACPGCGAEIGRGYGYHGRTAADVSVDPAAC